jgi:hypothetical protein
LSWAVRVYYFSLLSQFRDLLRSVLLLVEAGHIPAVFIVARSLFELGAHSYYVKKHVTQFLDAGDLPAAWNFLYDVNLGNRYMREQFGSKGNCAFPEPPNIGKVMGCFNEYFTFARDEKPAATIYSSLSEFSHPNCSAFMHHFEWSEDSSSTTKVTFGPPSPEMLALALPNVSIALVALLHCGVDLLIRVGDTQVIPHLRVAIDEVLSLQR